VVIIIIIIIIIHLLTAIGLSPGGSGKLGTVEIRGCGLVYGSGTNLGRSGRKPKAAVKVYDL
jgi:hypothetical protein